MVNNHKESYRHLSYEQKLSIALKKELVSRTDQVLFALENTRKDDFISWQHSNPFYELERVERGEEREKTYYYLQKYQDHEESPSYSIKIYGPTVQIGMVNWLNINIRQIDDIGEIRYLKTDPNRHHNLFYTYVRKFTSGLENIKKMWEEEGLEKFLWLLDTVKR